MPIYEYRCKDCGKGFEAMQKFSDKPIKKCVHCSGKNVEKLISRSSFVLKGTGWHQTDYAKKTEVNPCKEKSTSSPECASCPAAQSGK